jgi:hypothetical protein
MMAANLLTSIFLIPCAVVALMVAQVFLAAFITRRGVFFNECACMPRTVSASSFRRTALHQGVPTWMK